MHTFRTNAEHRTRTAAATKDPGLALAKCFGAPVIRDGSSAYACGAWSLKARTENQWQATFDAGYAQFLERFFKANGPKLGATCVSEEVPRAKDKDRAYITITIITNDPIQLAKTCLNRCKAKNFAENMVARYSQTISYNGSTSVAKLAFNDANSTVNRQSIHGHERTTQSPTEPSPARE